MSDEAKIHLAAGTPVGRYRVIGHLADGEAGAIYLAEMPGATKRRVALRILHADRRADGDLAAIFVEETRRALRLHHPNVVQTLDLVRTNDALGAALEFTPGLPVAALYPKGELHADVVPALVAWIGAEAAAGLHHAHTLVDASGQSVGIAHGDPCPLNVRIGFDGRVRVADFGMARALARVGKVASPHGPFAYASPEQVSGTDPDARSDVWTLGVVLWELLARYRLFRRLTDEETATAVANDEIPPLDEVREDVTAELESAIVRALERDVSKRWQTAKQMEEALRATLPRNVEAIRESLVAALAAPRDAYVERYKALIGQDARSIPTLGLAPIRGPVKPAATATSAKPYMRPASSPTVEAVDAKVSPAAAPSKRAALLVPQAPTPPPLPPRPATGPMPPPLPKRAPEEVEIDLASMPPESAAAPPAAAPPRPPPQAMHVGGAPAKPAPKPAPEPRQKPAAKPAPPEPKPAAPSDANAAPQTPFVLPPPAFVSDTPSVIEVPAETGPTTTPARMTPRSADARKRLLYIGGGGALLVLVVILAVSLSSGGEASDARSEPESSEPATSAPRTAEPAKVAVVEPTTTAAATTAPASAGPAGTTSLRIEANRTEAWVEIDGGARRDLPLDLTDLRAGAVLTLRAGAECCRDRRTTVTAGESPTVRLFLPEKEEGGEHRRPRPGGDLAKNPFGD